MNFEILNPEYLKLSYAYVTQVPYFVQSMGMITAISMVLTVLLFDHNYKIAIRAFIAKLIFIFFLLLVTYQRIQYAVETGITDLKTNSAAPLAGMTTLILFTFFWFLGLLLGGFIIRFTGKYQKKLTKDLKKS